MYRGQKYATIQLLITLLRISLRDSVKINARAAGGIDFKITAVFVDNTNLADKKNFLKFRIW